MTAAPEVTEFAVMLPPGAVDELASHLATGVFPLADADALAALTADIAAHGLHHPIVRTPRGLILDGRARLAACRAAGVEPRFVIHSGEPWRYVLIANAHKFTGKAHRALTAAELALNDRCPISGHQLEMIIGVPAGSLHRAKLTVRFGIPALRELALAERIPLTTAGRIAELPDQAQEEFVARIDAGVHHRIAGRPGRGPDLAPLPGAQLSQREARYRFVQEPAMQAIGNSFDALGMVLTSAKGQLDPAISPVQAAHWQSDLNRRAKAFRRLLNLLKERSNDRTDDTYPEATGRAGCPPGAPSPAVSRAPQRNISDDNPTGPRPDGRPDRAKASRQHPRRRNRRGL